MKRGIVSRISAWLVAEAERGYESYKPHFEDYLWLAEQQTKAPEHIVAPRQQENQRLAEVPVRVKH